MLLLAVVGLGMKTLCLVLDGFVSGGSSYKGARFVERRRMLCFEKLCWGCLIFFFFWYFVAMRFAERGRRRGREKQRRRGRRTSVCFLGLRVGVLRGFSREFFFEKMIRRSIGFYRAMGHRLGPFLHE